MRSTRWASMAIVLAGSIVSQPLEPEVVWATEQQAIQCRMAVVHCNYAHLYLGTFTWKSDISDADTRNTIDVGVTVTMGNATCIGAATTFEAKASPQTTIDSIIGPGLIAIEFGPDSLDQLSYNITAACPSPANSSGPSRPAELGNSFTQETYPQRATAIGMDLNGSLSYPAPETDSLNGVIGTITLNWNLKR